MKANDIPLGFLSGHAYGPDYSWQLNGMRSALNSLGRNEAEMLLTEYSPYTAAEYQKDGPVEKAEAAMTFFNALPGFLECTDLSFVNWAQYIDPGFFVGDKLGLIDRDSGARKALFNAFKLYGMMPSDRRRMSVSGSNVKGLTTAAGIWMTSGIGLAIGAGMYVVVIFTTILLFILQYVIYKMPIGSDAYDGYHLVFTVRDSDEFEAKLRQQLKDWGAQLTDSNITWQRDGITEFDFIIRRADSIEYTDIKEFAERFPEIVSFSYSSLTNTHLI